MPAWCDAYTKGCRTEIDRGLGYVCDAHIDAKDDSADDEQFDPLDHPIFVCGEHTCADVDEADLPPEHPEWVEHISTDDSWAQWRADYPERLARLTATPTPPPTGPLVEPVAVAEAGGGTDG